MVNGFFNVTGFSHFVMVNAVLVCCVSNGGRMKANYHVKKHGLSSVYLNFIYLGDILS